MKPNFALNLSEDGITLLNRSRSGWRSVGDVAIDAPDLSEQVEMLHKTAAGLAPEGITTLLIIPESQILYRTVTVPEGSDRQAGIEEAMDGATPYALDELAMDWTATGASVDVAVVAKETLAEAEGFAAAHKFNPVAFTAQPNPETYAGVPFFGETADAAKLLNGAVVTPESDPVEIGKGADRSEPPAPLPDLVEGDARAHADADTSEMAKTADTEADADAPKSEIPEQKDPVQKDPGQKDPEQKTPDQKTAAETSAETDADAAPTHQEPAGPVAFATRRPTSSDAPAPDAPNPLSARRARFGSAPAVEGPAAPSPTGKAPALTTQPVDPKIAPLPDLPQDPRPALKAVPTPTAAPTKAPEPSATSDETANPPAALAGVQASETPAKKGLIGKFQKAEQSAAAAKADTVAADAATKSPPAKMSRKEAKAAKKAKAAAIPDESAKMTIFGARKAPPPPRRKLGLLLTFLLLIVMLAVAVWSVVFQPVTITNLFNWGRATEAEIEITAAPEIAEEEAADAIEIAAIDGNADPFEQFVLARPQIEEPAQTDPLAERAAVDPFAVPLTPFPESGGLLMTEVEEIYRTSGVWVLPAVQAAVAAREDAAATLDRLYIASIDPAELSQDAVSLPDYTQGPGDFRPATPLPAPAVDAVFDLTPEGLVVATPEGALSPDGITVTATRPQLVPPARPDFQAAEDRVADAERQRLAAFTPKPRPDDLVELAERVQNRGLTQAELAKRKPLPRPASAQDIAVAEAVAEAVSAGGEEADVTEELPASQLAVATSRKPGTKPRNFDRLVARAKAKAAEEPEVQTASAARSTPKTNNRTPSIPSSASVSRAATVKSALNLRKVSLIGVYGTPKNRRALVRLPSGRFVKVSIGDRVNGGRVAEIGTSSVTYIKSGRNLTLEMPQG